MTAGRLVDPDAADQCAKPFRVLCHELGIDGDLAPAVLYRREILHTIVHDRLVQPFKPCATHLHVSRSPDEYWDQLVECAMDGAAKGARRRVDIFQGGPEPFHQRDTTFCRQHTIRLGDGLDLTDRLFQPYTGKRGSAPAVCVCTKPRLKSPSMTARHRSCPSEESGACRPSHSRRFDHHRLVCLAIKPCLATTGREGGLQDRGHPKT